MFNNPDIGSMAAGSGAFKGCAEQRLMDFYLQEEPLIFKELEEVQRSIERLCLQRNRLRKEVQDLSSQVRRFKATSNNSAEQQHQGNGRYIWVKKQAANTEKYTESLCISTKKKRNHRGHRKKKQDIKSIIKRCSSSFLRLTPKAQALPGRLARLSELLVHSFDDFFFLGEFYYESRLQASRLLVQNKVFTGSTPRIHILGES